MRAHSPLKKVNVSLVCFTCNDHALLCRNLSALPGWSLLPREIIVVDDASEEAFTPPPELLNAPGLPPFKIIRTPRNLGYAAAKNLGLHAASSRFLLSMDADISPCPRWLELCLPAAARPETGLVSGPIIADCGGHLFGSYMTLTYSFNTEVRGRVKFIPGAVWLMRRSVWQELGGYDGFSGNAGEDDYLCRQLTARGLELRVEPLARAFERRPMTRLHMARRGWKWHGASVYQALRAGRGLEEAINVLLYSLRPRILRSRRANPLFLYYDLLYLTYALLDLLANAARTAEKTACSHCAGAAVDPVQIKDAAASSSPLPLLLSSFQPWLEKFPALARALTADLTALGFSCAEDFILKKPPCPPHPGLNIEHALNFAFDQVALNTLELNLKEILAD